MARLNTRSSKPKIFTHEGAPAKRITPVQQLRRLVLPCLLWENNFYVDGKTIAEQIADAVRATDAAIAADVAIEARKQFHLRHVPLRIVREMTRLHAGTSIVSDTLAKVIQRPDEISEFVAMYWQKPVPAAPLKKGEKPPVLAQAKRQPLSAQVKKGLARAFASFDAYQLAKYSKGSGDVRLRDVMFLTHPKPSEQNMLLWKQLADDKLNTTHASEEGGTWEARLMTGQDKKTAFTDMLTKETLGYMALLRNLRGMLEAGVNRQLIQHAIVRRKGAGKVLPFRYVAAARACKELEPAIDKALVAMIGEMAPLPGTTFVLVDVSGSMEAKLSAKSDLTRLDAGAALAAIIPGDVRMFSFSNSLMEVPARRGMAGIEAIVRSQYHGGTLLGAAVSALNGLMHNNGLGKLDRDRLIVITDEQSHDFVPDPVARNAYMINVASHQNGVGYGKWTHIDGFSESVLRFIRELEK
ncbi:MAG: TROVE domain-containing protein [Verrucomicrobia bacterium]|nr:MAG: TROVE domain-containing protein [Verrucomicrobiota bacterium]